MLYVEYIDSICWSIPSLNIFYIMCIVHVYNGFCNPCLSVAPIKQFGLNWIELSETDNANWEREKRSVGFYVGGGRKAKEKVCKLGRDIFFWSREKDEKNQGGETKIQKWGNVSSDSQQLRIQHAAISV